MTSDLQEQHKHLNASFIITNLKELFYNRARHERYEASKALFRCQLAEGAQVGLQVIKMIGYIQRLETLGFVMDVELSMDFVLQSLPDSFSQFILNFNMNAMEKSLSKLLCMLKT
ncbi:uncharacterized protein LOC116119220 [Pistacia vera]|uniref:uncharacterized protein LOC116119220 n=1 Tax=Pistacia vera TaxID=55513 RepID=UPI00126304BB|nr:uncharacterized protein LOC116119220 [Pistacia vera]